MKLDGPTLARRAPAQVQIAESAHTNVSGRWYESTPGMLRVTIWLVVLIPSRYSFIMLGGLGSPALLAGLVLIGLWMIGAATGAETGPRKCVPLRLVLAGVWTTWLLSYVVMHRQGVPWDESGNADRLLIGLASWTGIALAGGEGIKSRHDLLLVVRCLVDAVAAMAAIAVLQFRTGWAPIELLDKIPILQSNSGFGGVLSRSSFRRPAGTAGHPIEYGVIVSSALALSIHLVIHDRDRSRFHRWAAFSLIALGIPIAVSRSALLVTSVVIIVFWFGEKGRIRVRSLGVVVAMFAFVFATIPGLIGTLKGYVLAGNSDSSISTRTSDYAAAAPYLRDSPWLGQRARHVPAALLHPRQSVPGVAHRGRHPRNRRDRHPVPVDLLARPRCPTCVEQRERSEPRSDAGGGRSRRCGGGDHLRPAVVQHVLGDGLRVPRARRRLVAADTPRR